MEPGEVEGYAREAGISFDEASTRLDWQERAQTLEDIAREELGGAFGGVWIDEADSRVKLGVATSDSWGFEAAQRAIAWAGLDSGADPVEVAFSYWDLEATVTDINQQDLAENPANPQMWVGVRTDINSVQLSTPPDPTEAQRSFVARVKQKHGAKVRTKENKGQYKPRKCTYPYCDPPLRGGIRLTALDPIGECTGGFVARSRSNGALFQLTAGHCFTASAPLTSWGTWFASAGWHVIGSFHNAIDNRHVVAGILTISNPSGWSPRAWVFVTQSHDTTRNEDPIRRTGLSRVNTRVCTTGGSFGGSDCGKITEVGVKYGNTTGLARANFGGTGGDSGAPVYAANTAFGLKTGAFSRCDSTYQGIREAENAMNVNVASSKVTARPLRRALRKHQMYRNLTSAARLPWRLLVKAPECARKAELSGR